LAVKTQVQQMICLAIQRGCTLIGGQIRRAALTHSVGTPARQNAPCAWKRQ
jgi:hypothetical protein